MTSFPDLTDFNVPALRADVQDMALRQDRYRREALSIGVPPECLKTSRLVQAAEKDAATLADLERLLAAIARSAGSHGVGPAPTRRGSFLTRALSVLAKGPSA